jgi:hypothetical protein
MSSYNLRTVHPTPICRGKIIKVLQESILRNYYIGISVGKPMAMRIK